MEEGEGERGEKRPREDEKSGEEEAEGPDRKKVKIGCGLKRGAAGSPGPPGAPVGRGRGRGLPGKFRPPRRVAKKEDMSTDGASESPPPPPAASPAPLSPVPSLVATPAPMAQNAPPSPPPSIVSLPVAPVPPPNNVRPLVVVKPGGQALGKPLVVVGAGAGRQPIVLTAPQQRPALVPPAQPMSAQPVPILDDESLMDEQTDPMDIPETVTFTSGSGRSLPAPSAKALAEVSRRLAGTDDDGDGWSVYVDNLKSNSSFQQPDGGEGERAGQGIEAAPVEFKVPVKRK